MNYAARRPRTDRRGRADRPAVSRPQNALRPVPRSSLRRLDPGRLLRSGRLLRQGPARRDGSDRGHDGRRPSLSINPKGEVVHLRTKQPGQPRLLGGKAVAVADKDDPRVALAKWMTAPDNPYFARATANWVWAQLFGKGLVDPPDDMSRANPPVHPELLDALAKHFIASKYDLRDLIRTIATSRGLRALVRHGHGQRARQPALLAPHAAPAHGPSDGRRAGPGDRCAQYVRARSGTGWPSGSPTRPLPAPFLTPSAAAHERPAAPRCRRLLCASARPCCVIGGDVIESKVGSLNGYLASALKLELEPEELIENLYLRTSAAAHARGTHRAGRPS